MSDLKSEIEQYLLDNKFVLNPFKQANNYRFRYDSKQEGVDFMSRVEVFLDLDRLHIDVISIDTKEYDKRNQIERLLIKDFKQFKFVMTHLMFSPCFDESLLP